MKTMKLKRLLTPTLFVTTFISLFLVNAEKNPNGTFEFNIQRSFANEGGEDDFPLHGSASTSLTTPSSSAVLSFNGPQIVNLNLKNNNVLGVTASVSCSYSTGDWNTAILPFTSVNKQYSVFRTTPVPWGFTISTMSDAYNILVKATW